MDWIALYGAVLSTVVLLWQLYTWKAKQRLDLDVDVRHGLDQQAEQLTLHEPVMGSGDPRDMLFPTDPVIEPAAMRYRLVVAVTNRGETSQFIDVIGLRRVGELEPIVFEPPDEKALQPARTVQREFHADLLGIRADDEFVAFVAIGEQTVESNPQRLHARLLADQAFLN